MISAEDQAGKATKPRNRRQTPAQVRRRITDIIGSGNLRALEEAGLVVVPVALLGELASYGGSLPAVPEAEE